MKPILIIFILSSSILCFSQTKREYFFKDLSINDSTSIILRTINPKTKFASVFNSRIYSDTNFLKELKEAWYFDYDPSKGISHYDCGYDMYFYTLSGSEYKFLKCLNSECFDLDIGEGKLNKLAESGKKLRVDTLSRIRMGTSPEYYFTEDLIVFIAQGDLKKWGYTRNKRFPEIYYDGSFKTNIQLDTNLTIHQNAEKFVSSYTTITEGINWNISESVAIKEFKENKKATKVEITVYLKASNYDYFKSFTINKIDFNIPKGSRLILYYKD